MLREGHGAGIEPAVNDLRHTVHLFTAFRALNGHCVDVWAMKLDVIRAVVGFFFQLFDAADAVLMAAFTLPYRKRSSPVTVSESPQSCTFSSQSPKRPLPILSGIQLMVLLLRIRSSLYCSHADEPGLTCVVDQRSIASPAVGIAVLEQRRIKQKILVLECLQNGHICFLTESACPRSFPLSSHLFVY